MSILEITSGSGAVLRLEETGLATVDAPATRGGAGDVVKKANQTLDSAIAGLQPAIATLARSFKEFNSPTEIELSFAFKLTAEAGAVVAKSGAEAHFAISLKWSADATETIK